MRFYGSAMRFPHVQGAFRDFIIADAHQCEKISPQTPLTSAACAEPLAVCLHAAGRAGNLQGKRVLVTGAGPIGSLCVAVARWAGADEIIATHLHSAPLQAAERIGATRVINLTQEPDAMASFGEGKGHFQVAFECSAAPAALKTGITALRPQGTMVQVGVAGDLPVPINLVVGNEIHLIGTHRFHAEFRQAVTLIDSGAIAVAPIITTSFPIDKAVEAFELAHDRTSAVKVQLTFS